MADPSTLGLFARFQHSLWALTLNLKTPSAKLAIKTGLGAALLGLPAFIPQTRPIWVELRMGAFDAGAVRSNLELVQNGP
jgi:hypothetical protein